MMDRVHQLVSALTLAVFPLACGGIEEPGEIDDGEELAQDVDPLYVASSKVWSNRTVHVCWIDSGWSTEKGWVRDAVMSSWPRVANVTFDNWGRCPSPSLQPFWPFSNGVRIRIADEGPRVSALGRDLANLGQTMTLNFSFANWSTSYCAGGNRESCIRAIAAHEFGHALGFAHEQNRPDTDRTVCTDAPQGSNGDMTLGAWDLSSIMNYCNPDWNNEHVPGFLSPGDVAGVRTIYGTRGDALGSPISLSLNPAETTIYGSTLMATNDGPAAGIGCSGGPNVWYSFTLAQTEVVYVDTAGSSWDTSIHIVDGSGAVVPGFARDDAGCIGGDWREPNGYESSVSGVLGAGTYRLSVGGCGSNNFQLHVQHLPQSLGSYFEGQLPSGSGTATSYLIGASALSSSCGGSASGEDVRWFPSCGGQPASFSVCPGDGGTYVRSNGTVSFDPTAYAWSGVSAAITACNDDGESTIDCTGTGGDSLSYGSRLSVTTARGINGFIIDERNGGTPDNHGMDYTMAYSVP